MKISTAIGAGRAIMMITVPPVLFLSVALPFAGFYFCSFVHIRKHSEDLVGSLIL